MVPFSLLFVVCLIPSVLSFRDVGRSGRKSQAFARRHPFSGPIFERPAKQRTAKRAAPIIAQTEAVKRFAVDGAAIPEVDWDIGESYAGLLPISNKPNETNQLYFWFFPTTNPDGKDDLTIWLNGGPGCSSLEGLLQENGPFLWQYGTFKPVKNPYTWLNLTNMVWVEQPVGTGFSQGNPTETNEEDVAASFMGFFKNFIDTFGLKNKKIYIAGESYAGMYVPYIADAFFNQENTEYFNVQGTMIYDPSINSDLVLQQIPAAAYVEAYDSLFNLNDTTMSIIRERATKCGYTDFIAKHMKFPPNGPLPNLPTESWKIPFNCDIWGDINDAILQINPCFDIYSISTTCPVLWDVLGFPGSFDYVPQGANIYFNRPDVQRAINAPPTTWAECGDAALGNGDSSLPSALTVLPSVIDRSQRTIIAHGQLDFILLYNGTLLTIQNMTWGGKQGFQSPPDDDFYVPYHSELNNGTLAAAGVMGITHTERKLTWVEVYLAGHMIPQYAPSAAYRQMEYLLGRIPSLTTISPFTTQPNVAQMYDAAAAAKTNSSGMKKDSKLPLNATKLTQRELFGMLNGDAAGKPQ